MPLLLSSELERKPAGFAVIVHKKSTHAVEARKPIPFRLRSQQLCCNVSLPKFLSWSLQTIFGSLQTIYDQCQLAFKRAQKRIKKEARSIVLEPKRTDKLAIVFVIFSKESGKKIRSVAKDNLEINKSSPNVARSSSPYTEDP